MVGRADKNLSHTKRARAQARGAHASSMPARPKERQSVPFFLRILIIVFIVGALGTAIFFISRYLDGSWQAKDAINAAISHVEESDETIVALNDSIVLTVDEASEKNVQELQEQAVKADEVLKKADEKLARANALDEFLDDNQKSICDALRNSIDARRTMLDAGEAVLSVDATVGGARALLNQVVEKAVSANKKSQEATQAANEYAQFLTGDTSVSTQDANVALQLDNEAKALIDEAKTSLASAKEAFADADYSAYETYLNKRSEAINIMIESDTALVSGDFASVSDKTNAYNVADAAATEAANALPSSTSEIYAQPYENLTSGARKTYTSAAEKAAEADALIRHYQGVAVSMAATSQDIVDTDAAATTSAASGQINELLDV